MKNKYKKLYLILAILLIIVSISFYFSPKNIITKIVNDGEIGTVEIIKGNNNGYEQFFIDSKDIPLDIQTEIINIISHYKMRNNYTSYNQIQEITSDYIYISFMAFPVKNMADYRVRINISNNALHNSVQKNDEHFYIFDSISLFEEIYSVLEKLPVENYLVK